MLTITYDLKSQRISLFVDGVLDHSESNIPTPNATTSADLYIGKEMITNSYHFKDKMDEIRNYKRLLNQAEIIELLSK